MIDYEFVVGSVVTIRAERGTDPESLKEQVRQKIIDGIDSIIERTIFDVCYDEETDEFYRDWRK